MKLKDCIGLWLNEFAFPNIKRRTYDCYREIAQNHIIPQLGEFEMNEITTSELQQFVIGKLKNGNLLNGSGLSSNTLNSIITVLKNTFSCALTLDIVNRNPAGTLKRIRSSEKPVDAFTMREQRIIESAVERSKNKNMYGVTVCLYTGLRIGELLGLTWDDVNLRTRTISVSKTAYRIKTSDGKWENYLDTPKTRNSRRIIPISQKLVDIFKILKDCRTCEYVIETNGHATSVRTYQTKFATLLKRNGLRLLGFHSLRHTFATRIVESGADIKTLSEIMGHKNAVVTLNRYVHSRLDIKRKALNKLTKYVN